MPITSTAILSDIQKLAPGDLIELFALDATALGATDIFYFCGHTDGGAMVELDSVSYLPLSYELSGVEIKSSEQSPEPLLKLSNVNNSLGTAINSFGDLVGAKLTRRRTFTKYLDGHTQGGNSHQFAADVFIIEQKTQQNKYVVEFRLVLSTDFSGYTVPHRQVIRDICPFVYRVYDTDTSTFIYDHVIGCPYTGTDYYDVDGEITTVDKDKCGHRISDCKLRFPTRVPYGGFPGISKYRIS